MHCLCWIGLWWLVLIQNGVKFHIIDTYFWRLPMYIHIWSKCKCYYEQRFLSGRMEICQQFCRSWLGGDLRTPAMLSVFVWALWPFSIFLVPIEALIVRCWSCFQVLMAIGAAFNSMSAQIQNDTVESLEVCHRQILTLQPAQKLLTGLWVECRKWKHALSI